MSTLFVVATPIGHLGDMTPRAVDVLRAVSLIAAEDTRHSVKLFRHFNISTPVMSYHQHNQHSRESVLLTALGVGDVALITDAGTPAIADPGHHLVQLALGAGHHVVPIPGASSLVSAVSVSGLVPGPFLFLGFLPRAGEGRRTMLGKAIAANVPVVIFESPVRVGETLADLRDAFGSRQAMVGREITKMHEEFRYGTLEELADAFADTDPRGEIVIVVGATDESEQPESDIRRVVEQLLDSGLKPSKVAREAAAITGVSGSDAYDVVRQVASERDGQT